MTPYIWISVSKRRKERIPFVFMGWIWSLFDRPKRRETLTNVTQRHIPEYWNPEERSGLCACLSQCIK
jgi:hypothetical protein